MQTGFYFDQARCTGCFTCSVACKDWHDTPAGPANYMRIQYREGGKFPNLFISHVASPCYHCAEPVCAYVCPNEALTKRDEDGIVIVDRDKCRGDTACGIISESAYNSEYLYGEAEAPCQVACPAGLRIPAYVALIAKGKNKEALELIRRQMPLPSVCGRVCLHPCETACRRKDVEEPVSIMALKGFVTDNVPVELPEPVPQTQTEKVAVIGSGPAGLAAAYDLVRAGYGTTVFESLPMAGGMLAVGVPENRLPREILKRDIDYIEALGVEIKTSSPVDLGQGLDDLFNQGYGAVLLALGAHKGQKPNIPGADLQGTAAGTAFMKDVNTGNEVDVGQKVLLVGGGNVALDCARTALRLGAAEVQVACLESDEAMTAEASEIEQAREEGIILNTSLSVTRIIEDSGKVAGAECVGISGLQFTQGGQPQFETVSGSERTIEADMVIFAIGQTPDLAGLASDGDIATSPQGTIVVDPETMMTGRRGIFSAGDCYTGATSIIDAIADGQKAAFYIDRYLQGDVLRVIPKPVVQEADIQVEIPTEVEQLPRQAVSTLPVSERISNFKEVSLGFEAEAAIKEAERCLNCAGHLCKDVCPYSAPQFADEEKAKMQKCDLCLERWFEDKKPVCVEACPMRALDAGPLDELQKKYGDNRDAVGFVYSEIAEPAIVNKPKKAALK
ncbi:MAG: FAD-dependent oxidoreductase [Deltaproteobacteria bacterium]|nr:FAD-dependent oxidoreductase [Deltaproteobacteria bacterium]MBW2051926.1 FAD-dependent oxidoreductase [Deltaproteobacteria bacterium]